MLMMTIIDALKVIVEILTRRYVMHVQKMIVSEV